MVVPKAKQLPSGSWFVQVVINGRRVGKAFNTKKEAEIWALSVKSASKKSSKKDDDYARMLKDILGKTVSEKRKSKLPTVAEELEKIDSMKGVDFEIYCSSLFKLTGFFHGAAVYNTRGTGDFGADIVIECVDGTRVVVQCKRLRSNVGIDAIQEVYSSKAHYYASEAAVLTNAHFTPAAKELAKNNGVYLLDREHLIQMIELYIRELDRTINKTQWANLMDTLLTTTSQQ